MKTKFMLAVGALILAAVTVFVVVRSPEAGRADTKITIAQSGDFYLYAPLYIAADNGIFQKNGLTVSIVSTGGDEKTWAAVIAKSAQFGVSDPTFIALASQRGQPGRIVATVVNGVPFWGITKNDAIPAITKPAELSGYTVATFPSPSTAYTLQAKMFADGGLPPKIREGGWGTLLALTETKEADIALELEPNVSQAVVASGYKVVYSLADIYGDFAITGLVAAPDYIKENPATVAACVQSIKEALAFIHNNPAQTAEILAQRFPEIRKDIAIEALRRVIAAGVIPQTPVTTEQAWKNALQLRIDAGEIKETSNVMEFVDNTFAQ
ncbi:MAG: ABC transporter substrate-binding protein [Planctomycetota bacterium]|jgi:NitT/TauT family transport system substrate-binding protein|nr:ABC transporter substrate-binding protein [Planctomycetota bacterium]